MYLPNKLTIFISYVTFVNPNTGQQSHKAISPYKSAARILSSTCVQLFVNLRRLLMFYLIKFVAVKVFVLIPSHVMALTV